MTKEEPKTLEVVPHVELERYLGKWYEIAKENRKTAQDFKIEGDQANATLSPPK